MSGADETLLAGWLDEFLDDVLEGRATDVEDYVARRPDLEERIHELHVRAHRLAGRRLPTEPRVPGYRIVREIGRGGMGAVYLAHRDGDETPVALKILPTSYGLTERARSRFLREARALATVENEHVVAVLDLISDDAGLAIAMEFVDGPTLADVAKVRATKRSHATWSDVRPVFGDGATLPDDLTLIQWSVKLTAQVARALGAVHAAGLVHRDVKPSNVLLRRDGTAVLADFGLVRDLASSATRTDVFVGTLCYAAPEQLRGGDDSASPRSDIYSLGATLWELVAGMPPTAGRSPIELLESVEAAGPPWLRRVAPEAPRDLETILLRALDPDPDRRFQTAEEFAAELELLLRWQPIRSRRPGKVQQLSRATRRHRKVLGAAALGAAALAITAAVSLGLSEQAADRRAEARADAADARRSLLSGNARRRAYGQIVLGQSPQFLTLQHGFGTASQSLVGISDRLAAAASALPDADTLETESLLVAIAAGRGPAGPGVGEPPTERYDLGRLSEPLRRYVEPWSLGALTVALAPVDLGDASERDRHAIGLLAFLTGDVLNCAAAWTPLDPVTGSDPLIDAGLGLLFAIDGRPERAYPRLLQALRHFENDPLLAVTLAEVAVALDDPALAGRWLERARAAEADPLDLALAHSDLLRLSGDHAAALTTLEDLTGDDPRIPLRRARLCRELGDPTKAAALADELLERFPAMAQARLERARCAVATRDRAAYLEQVDWVVAHDYLAGRSPGTRDSARELLALGELYGLVARAEQAAGPTPTSNGPRWVEASLRTPLFQHPERVEELVLRRRAWRVARRGEQQSAGPSGWLRPLRTAAELLQWFPETAPLVSARSDTQAALRALAAGLGASWPLLAGLDHGRWIGSDDQRSVDQHLVAELPGTEAGLRLGLVEALGDVDGDGYPDLATGSFRNPVDGLGYLAVVSGRDHREIRVHRGPGVGSAAAGIGDQDRDGHADLAYVELEPRPDATPDAVVRVRSGADGRLLTTLRAPGPTQTFGNVIQPVDDLDGDGSPEIAVGDMGTAGGSGVVRIFSIHSESPLTVAHGPRGASFGLDLEPIPDRDGDGLRDLLVSAPGAHGARGALWILSSRTGRVLARIDGPADVILFGIAIATGADIDQDGMPDYAVTAARSGGPGAIWIRSGVDDSLLIHWQSSELQIQQVLCFGDWTGDGMPELAAGRPLAGSHSPGRLTVWSGESLVQREPRAMLQLVGRHAGDECGASLARLRGREGARDLLCVSAPGQDGEARQGGAVLVLDLLR